MLVSHLVVVFVYRPIRINLGLNNCLKMIGKRAPFITKYKVRVSPIFMFDFEMFHKSAPNELDCNSSNVLCP